MPRKDELGSRGGKKQGGADGEALKRKKKKKKQQQYWGRPPPGVGLNSRRRVSTFFLALFIPNLFPERCSSRFPQRTYAKRSGS